MVLKLDDTKVYKDSEESSKATHQERGGGAITMSRLNFFRIGLLGGFTLLGWRLWDMQKPLTTDPDAERNGSSATREPTRIVSKAPRGIIYDRNGKRLVTNTATYSVTITELYLPDPAKGKTKDEVAAITQQRQDVYDNLARFLGMNYFIAIIPEQVNGVAKKGVFTNPERNAILNELEILTGTSARDWDTKLADLNKTGKDKDLLIVNQDSPIPVEKFDMYKYLRDKYTQGVLFLSDGELKMLQSRFYTPAYQPIEIWRNLSREDAMRLDERRLDFPGVGVQTSYVREYDNPRLYSHILGYTGRFGSQEQLDNANKEAAGDYIDPQDPNDPSSKIPVYEIDDKIGRTGVEAWMEPYLRGRKGAKEVLVNSSGQILSTIKIGKPAQPGNNVTLTIDGTLQAQVADALEKWIGEANKQKPAKVKEGAAVVMDVNTGEVLAMVAFPFYDNNLYNKEKWSPAEIAEFQDEDKAVQVNRATSARYAPGSTFKLVTAAAAINEKKFVRGTTVVCNHYIQIPITSQPEPSQSFRCWGTHGAIDVVGGIENSCDIFFYNAAVPDETNQYYGRSRYYNRGSKEPIYFRGIGINVLNAYMELFNIGKPSGIELPGEYSGNLPTPDKRNGQWSIGDTMTTSIGQGDLEITPLQMCMITATFANGGKLYQPRIVRGVKDPNGKDLTQFSPKLIRDVTKDSVKWNLPDPVDATKRQAKEFVLGPGVIDLVRQGMLAVTSATGTAASQMYGKVGSLKVAGKTGTAEYGDVIGKDKDGNDVRATRAWFTAFAPYDNPQVAVTVLITAGENSIEGSTYAVPAVREILAAKFPNLVNQKA